MANEIKQFKYRIMQVGDLYSAQCRLGEDDWCVHQWDTKEIADRVIARWKEKDIADVGRSEAYLSGRARRIERDFEDGMIKKK